MCMVTRLQHISTGHTVISMFLVVNLDLSLKRIGKIRVIPIYEAYPAIMTSSFIHPYELDICTAVGRNTPPLNWNTMANAMDMRMQTGVGSHSL